MSTTRYYVGIDDTDTLDTPGTNQLARALVARLAPTFSCVSIVRHQLLFDPRVPYTSKNGSASIVLDGPRSNGLEMLLRECRAGMRAGFNPGSDPGLCLTTQVPAAITAFGRRCQAEVVNQEEARALARNLNVHLEGLGGTEGGVIGALAAVGLIVTGNDGRIVQLGTWPDDLSGPQPLSTLQARGVEPRAVLSGEAVAPGWIDVGKHLRPNYREGKAVLFVEEADDGWHAVRRV